MKSLENYINNQFIKVSTYVTEDLFSTVKKPKQESTQVGTQMCYNGKISKIVPGNYCEISFADTRDNSNPNEMVIDSSHFINFWAVVVKDKVKRFNFKIKQKSLIINTNGTDCNLNLRGAVFDVPCVVINLDRDLQLENIKFQGSTMLINNDRGTKRNITFTGCSFKNNYNTWLDKYQTQANFIGCDCRNLILQIHNPNVYEFLDRMHHEIRSNRDKFPDSFEYDINKYLVPYGTNRPKFEATWNPIEWIYKNLLKNNDWPTNCRELKVVGKHLDYWCISYQPQILSQLKSVYTRQRDLKWKSLFNSGWGIYKDGTGTY